MRHHGSMAAEARIRGIVVDDDPQIRQILRRLLPSAGVEVCAEFSSGEEAVDWMESHDADVVVMDINMPGIGGTEATRRIKRSKPDALIFGFTAWGKQDSDEMVQAGATAVFDKTQLPQLIDAVRATF